MARIVTENGDIQLKDGTACPLTFSRADIRDLTKRTGNKSKTLTAVGDSDNNQILGFLFDVNATDGTFNINQTVACQLYDDDDNMVMDNSIMQLVNIEKRQPNMEQDDEVTYSLLIKSKEADLFTLMDNDELTDLDFSELNHTYEAVNVVASFTHDVTDGYVYPQGISDDGNFDLTDFRPAIYLKRYFDKIHAKHGFGYEVQGFDIFDKLVIPFNGDNIVGNGLFETSSAEATKSLFSSADVNITTWFEIFDDEEIFNPTTGVLTSPFYITNGQGLLIDVTFDFELFLDNNEASDVYLQSYQTNPQLHNKFYVPIVEVYKNGGSVPVSSGNIGSYTAERNDVLVSGNNSVLTATGTVTIAVSNLDVGDTLTFRLKVRVIGTSFSAWRLVSDNSIADVDARVDMADMTLLFNFTANSFGYSQEVDMNLFIPKKIKQKDLIKSITTLANLMVVTDEDEPNKILYITRDSWLDSGVEVDWTKKLVKNNSQNIQFLPELSAKKMLLTYKEDKDIFNKSYKDSTNEVYGEVEFTFDSEFAKGIEKKEIAFSPTPMTTNPNGSHCLSMVGNAPKNNIRLLIHNGALTCNAYNIYDYSNVGELNITTYANVGHFDHPTNPTIDLNFGVCDFYFYPNNIVLTNNNMFNLYWRRTASQINNGKMMTAEFDLNPYDIVNLKLNQKIFIENAWWHINQILDYDAVMQKFTKVELISVDEYIDFARFRTRPTVAPPIRGTGRTKNDLIKEYYLFKNLNLSEGSMDVIGKGNVVQQNLKGVAIGNDEVITDDGIFYDGVDNTTNPAPLLNVTILEIGDWDMDSTGTVNVAHGLLLSDIRSWEVSIIRDDSLNYAKLITSGSTEINTTDVTLRRVLAGKFDTTDYDATTFNRGFITIWHV